MKAIFLSSIVLFTALFAVNLDAGQGRSRSCHHCHHHHHSKSRVSFNVGTAAVAGPVVVPAATYIPVQQAPIVVAQPTYYAPEYVYPVTYVEYQQPVVVVRPQPRPWNFFNFGFSFGN